MTKILMSAKYYSGSLIYNSCANVGVGMYRAIFIGRGVCIRPYFSLNTYPRSSHSERLRKIGVCACTCVCVRVCALASLLYICPYRPEINLNQLAKRHIV